MDGVALQKFLNDRKWWIEETDGECFLHVVNQEKEYISKPIKKLHTQMFKNDFDMKVAIVNLAIGSIETQIMRDENQRKMSDLKINRRKTISIPYGKKKNKECKMLY